MATDKTSGLGSRLKLVGTVVALALLVIFIVLNFDDVEVDFAFASQTISLAFALIIAAVLGFLIGYFAPHRR
jgi:uncharacterized integral membrane protein